MTNLNGKSLSCCVCLSRTRDNNYKNKMYNASKDYCIYGTASHKKFVCLNLGDAVLIRHIQLPPISAICYVLHGNERI